MKKIVANVVERNYYQVTVEVEDGATESDIYNAIKEAYMEDDYEIIEQYIFEINDMKELEK